MDYKKIITGLLSKAYKFDDGKISEIFKEDETEETIINALLEEDVTRIKAVKDSTNAEGKFQEGYAKAKKEVLTQFEEDIKKKYPAFSDSKEQGVNLIAEIVKANTKGGEELTDEQVKQHKLYVKLEQKLQTEIDKIKTESDQQVNTVKAQYEKEKLFGEVRTKASVLLDTLKPVLPKSSVASENLKTLFFKNLEEYEYKIHEGGTIQVLKDGKLLEDAHGNSVNFNDHVKTYASKFFEFQANPGGGNPGGGGEGGEGGQLPTFENEEAAIKYAQDTNIPLEQRTEALDAYNASKK